MRRRSAWHLGVAVVADTDNGFGAGTIGSIASFDATHTPYKWQLQFATFIAVRGSITSPSYEDAFVNLIVPQLLADQMF